jgi:threonine dehydrogenase-like Zn-dependent dehydrogenase
MKALVMDFSLTRAALTLTLSKISKKAFFSPVSLLSFKRNYPEPKLPNSEWVKVKTEISGICGSDLRLITLKESFYLYPVTSFPLILGHEIVGEIEEVGSRVGGFEEGERVVIDNVLPCRVRGLEECRSCREGRYSICHNFDRGNIAPGIFTGFCKDTGGGWGEYLVAHKHQLVRVPDGLSSRKAVFAEPFAICLHAVLKAQPKDEGLIAIVGCGMMGIGIAKALRVLGFKGEIVGLDVNKNQLQVAKDFGVNRTIWLKEADAVEAVAELTGGRVHHPPREKSVLVGGGAEIVFECVGNASTFDTCLRIASPGGRVMLVGTASKLSADLTPLFSKEVKVIGVFGSGMENVNGRKRSFEMAIELFQKGVDFSPLLTHEFPIERYKEALWVAMNKEKYKAVKVAFTFGR